MVRARVQLPTLIVPPQPALPVPVEVSPKKAPLIVRIDDTLQPYAIAGFITCAAIPAIACAGVWGYESFTGTVQTVAFRQAGLLGQLVGFGIPALYIVFQQAAALARQRFEG